jgi:hypothetical protein
MQLPQMSRPLALEEGAKVDLLVGAPDAVPASSNGVGSSQNPVGNPTTNPLLPIPNEIKAINMCALPPLGAPAIGSGPCFTIPNLSTITSPRQITTSDQPHIADSDLTSDAMLPVAADSTVPNDPGELILSTPNLIEETIAHESPEEFIASVDSSFAASQSSDASRQPTVPSYSRCSPELGLAPEAFAIGVDEASPAHQTVHLHEASPSLCDNLNQTNSTPIIQPIDPASSEAVEKIEREEVEKGTPQVEFTPNIDNVSHAGPDGIMLKGEPAREPPQILMSMAR